ncbi:MAG: hypothetical protein ACE5R4_13500 [Armatimonadota bacterium]
MLPFQQPPEDERMPVGERIEWAVMIVGILLWWPKLLMMVYHPSAPSRACDLLVALVGSPVYDTVIYAVVPLALIAVFIRRLRRFLTLLQEQEEEHDRRHPPKSRM